MSANPPPSRRVYQDIARKLADQIISRKLPEGSCLPSERVLAENFGASRTSVREALLSLQASGFISMREKARARVSRANNAVLFSQLTGSVQGLLAQPHGVADLQEARMLFECGLARYAARHASPKEVDRLAVALAENRAVMGSPEEFAKTDLAFHTILAEIPRNPIFTAMNAALSEWLQEQRDAGIRLKGAIVRAYEGHEQVFRAIANHDSEAADLAMTEHLKIASVDYWTAKEGGTAKPPRMSSTRRSRA
ncbi:MAG: FCD domain-containing protein [Opitutaceae bacterium]|nr:FCD domain-containing protein [Opitutaceae bacterium]